MAATVPGEADLALATALGLLKTQSGLSERFAVPKHRAASRGTTARCSLPITRLLQISRGRQIELARRDESSAAPVGAEPTRINAGEVAREPCRVVAGESVAVTLAVVSVVVPQVEREHVLGDADADVPGGVAVVGNAVRIWRGAAGSGDLGAEEVIGGPW